MKFSFSHVISFMWMVFSIYASLSWVQDMSHALTEWLHLPFIFAKTISLFIATGIAYIPGYLNAFLVTSLLVDRQPRHQIVDPDDPVTVIIACRNEAQNISDTILYIAKQDYRGKIHVIVANNGSTDHTAAAARHANLLLGNGVTIVNESKPGKSHALNAALSHVKTELVITLDADTLLHQSAIKHIVARFKSSPPNVCAVAGTVLVRNSRKNLLARIQEWDYFLGIASVKRLQGLYQGTLVAQGAYSLYRLDVLRNVGGWDDVIGEDIVLTWKFLSQGFRVYFEPLAVAFTDVPESITHLQRQRSRWARGMIEALRAFKPWHQPSIFQKYLTGTNLVMPYLDFIYTCVWIPGLFASFFGYYWIVGLSTLFVLPLTFLTNWILYRHQKWVFKELNLQIRKNKTGFVFYVLFYQMIMSPISVIGYFQELFRLTRVWK
jgi:poly-beta-1,6-N-acetyl-D-glucosamine synthase